MVTIIQKHFKMKMEQIKV